MGSGIGERKWIEIGKGVPKLEKEVRREAGEGGSWRRNRKREKEEVKEQEKKKKELEEEQDKQKME